MKDFIFQLLVAYLIAKTMIDISTALELHSYLGALITSTIITLVLGYVYKN
jgi:hypothetical protein